MFLQIDHMEVGCLKHLNFEVANKVSCTFLTKNQVTLISPIIMFLH